MFKINQIKQEASFCDGDAGGFGFGDLQFEAKERYNSLLEVYKEMDPEDMTIEHTNKIGINNWELDKSIIFFEKFINGEMKSKYPNLQFTGLNKNTIRSYTKRTGYITTGKRFEFSITGQRSEVRRFHVNELNYTNMEFNEQFPTKREKAEKKVIRYINVACSKENINKVRHYFKNLKRNYYNLEASINEDSSLNETSWKVKFFNKQCNLRVKLHGAKLEIDFLKQLFEKSEFTKDIHKFEMI